MKTLFAVTRTRGKAWDQNKSMRSQNQWTEHALFMNRLASDGFIVLGGPLEDGIDILLVVDAVDEDEIISNLADDPWSISGILEVKLIQSWSILLESGK